MFLNSLKRKIISFFLKKKVKFVGKNVYIKKKYSITGGKYVKIGSNVSILEGASINCFDKYSDIIYNPEIIIGDGVYANRFFTIYCASRVVIKDNTYIGAYVTITDENHGVDLSSNMCFGLQPLSTKPIEIGHNCWIGEKVTILPGVTIGDNCVIGAGSVVTKSIPSGSLCCGNPAKVVKRWSDKNKEWQKI